MEPTKEKWVFDEVWEIVDGCALELKCSLDDLESIAGVEPTSFKKECRQFSDGSMLIPPVLAITRILKHLRETLGEFTFEHYKTDDK
jgi:hypothetical protein